MEVSPDGEVFELLDRRYPWQKKKEKTLLLSELYQKAGYPETAEKVRDCGTFLQFGVYADGERRLQAANFCQQRLCPLCISRRARRYVYKLSQVMDTVEQEHKGVKFLFLTLALRNVTDGAKLGDALTELTKAWNRLLKQRQIERAVKGWYRAIEITRGDDRLHYNEKSGKMEIYEDNGYHPHIHAILCVDGDYFSNSRKYLEQKELIQRWKKAARVDYEPTVHIQVAKARRRGGGVEQATLAAAKEAGKYPVKDVEYIDPTLPEERAVGIVRDYTEALYKRRLCAYGGWMKEVARALDAEKDDLIHVDEGDIRTDIAVMVETYHWHFGAGDYLLMRGVQDPRPRARRSK